MGKAFSSTHQFQTNVATATTPVGTPMNVQGYSVVGFQIVGLNTGTIQWEGNISSGEPLTTSWIAVRATDLNTGTAATTATADGISQFDCRGVVAVRARVTTLSIVNGSRLDIYGFAQAETT